MSRHFEHCVVMVSDLLNGTKGPEEIEFDGFGDDLTTVVLCGQTYKAGDAVHKTDDGVWMIYMHAEGERGPVADLMAASRRLRVDLDVTFIELL